VVGDMVGETPAAAAQAVGASNFQDTQSIPMQLQLYTVLKNLHLQKYIITGQDFDMWNLKSLSSYFPKKRSPEILFFSLALKIYKIENQPLIL
jgi:hypothetical protein